VGACVGGRLVSVGTGTLISSLSEYTSVAIALDGRESTGTCDSSTSLVAGTGAGAKREGSNFNAILTSSSSSAGAGEVGEGISVGTGISVGDDG